MTIKFFESEFLDVLFDTNKMCTSNITFVILKICAVTDDGCDQRTALIAFGLCRIL
jgi:hypothetical protein